MPRWEEKPNQFESALRAVGGVDGIKRCLAAGNDAPLELVLDAGRREIKRLADILDLCEPDNWPKGHPKNRV